MNPYNQIPEPQIKEYILEKLRVGSRRSVSKRHIMLSEVEFRQWFAPMTDALVFDLQAYVLAKTHEPVRITYPTTWWDAVKARFAPNWLKAQCDWAEADYTTIVLDPKSIFPYINVGESQYDSHVRIFRHEFTSRY